MQLTAGSLRATDARSACQQLSSRRRQRQQHAGGARRAPLPPQASLFGDLFEFEKWAPRSSQAWRLGNGADLRRASAGEGEEEAAAQIGESDVEVLNQRLAEARRRGEGAAAAVAAAEAAAEEAAAARSSAEEEADAAPSFLRSTDEEVAASLADRISEVASALGTAGSSADSEDEGAALTGPLLRQLIETKWGKAYDLSFVRRDLPLGKTLICLNVMWTHLEQRSFPMSEEEYDEKLDLVAMYLNSWGQAERVEAFLRQPARPRKGMPSKPIVGTAISIQLDLEDAVINEFFAQGGA
ncbi:hypothetical protein ABPG75_012519 [Micractinium tetrahymenae]